MLSAVGPLAAETNAFSLTVQVDPPGSGTVDRNPEPPYSQNQVVTLTATPATGFVFDRWVLADDAKWWDAGWDYRVKVTADAAGYARKNKPAEFNVNFTQLWTSLGKTGTLDPNSIRVVEVDANDVVIDADVPFQFDKAADYNAANKAAGTLVLIMEGNTAAGATRAYHVYFDVTGKGFAAPNVPPQVILTEEGDGGIASFKIQTATGTIFIHKPGGGVSSYNDINGNDWINWSTATGAEGQFRGIPNAVGGSNSGFHPGNGGMTGTILSQGPIKTTLHFRLAKPGSCNIKRWEGIFEIYPNYSTFTMLQACVSSAKAYPFWLLYEGTPGGKLDPTTDYVVFSDGSQINTGQTRNGDLPNEEWAYVVDPNVGAAGRAIFLANHKDDTQNDTFYPDTGKVMTILGFGRDGSTLLIPGSSAPHSYTFGLMDEIAIDNAKPIIYNAYRSLNTSVGSAESRSGAALGTQNPVQFTVTGEHTVIAQFKPAQYTVTVGVSPAETGTVVKSPNKATYNHGEEVTLTAAPTAAGYNFAGWQGDVTGTTNPITVPVTKNMVVTALFTQSFTITTSAVPAEGGTVILDPPGPTFAPGSQVTVTAVPNNGYSFTNWSGDLSGSNPVEIITVNSNRNLIANFGQPQFTFNATSAGNGSVDWTPKKDFYAPNEQITVTATANTGFAFSQWTGDLTSTVNPLVFPISGNTAIVGNFVATQEFTVSVSVPGGGGNVTKSPDQAGYPNNTIVTLTAVPDTGKKFVSWGGDATGTNPVTQITVTKNMVVTATFADDGYPLTVTLNPTEGGSVTKTPNQAFYLPGTVVTLTATVASGWTFQGWSGDATGTNLTTTVTMPDRAAVVTATFLAPGGPFTLNVSTAGSGTGGVTILPDKEEYIFGEVVKLTAVPGPDSVFAGWSGGATGTKNPLNVTMDSDKTIVATFIMPNGPFTDQFDTCSLSARWGQPIDPLGGGSFSVDGTHLTITVPEGPSHNVWLDGNNAPRVMQNADNVDFEYIVKFDSPVTQSAQMQGIIVEESAQRFIRFDFEYNDGVKAYAASILDGSVKKHISVPVNASDAVYMKITRVGTSWSMFHSSNGIDWLLADKVIKNVLLDVNKVGVFAGNVAVKGNPAPAHTASVDYFHNTAEGPLPAERPLVDITTVGSGSVSTNPPLDQLACGQTVTLTAQPAIGFAFGSWSGDASGTQRSVSLLLDEPKAVTATFVVPTTQKLLVPLIIR